MSDKWKVNTGRKPHGSKGKRVRVKLRGSGAEPLYGADLDKMAPPGWAADTTRWSLNDEEHDVTHFMIL